MDDAYLDQDRIPKIDAVLLRQLSVLRPWRSISAIILDWLIIVFCILICEKVSYWCYPLVFVIVGTRFHGLEAMMHEATHYRLHPNRKINEIIGELAVWPMGLSVLLYRNARHFSHHQNIGSRRDAHTFQSYDRYEDRFNFPTTFSQLMKNCIKVAFLFPKEIWWGQFKSSATLLAKFSKVRAYYWWSFQIFTLVLIGVLTFFLGFNVLMIYALFFVIPLLWIALFSRYLRLVTEHFGIPIDPPSKVVGSETRTVLVSWPIRILFWPHLLNYHIEHHWYPSVPFYQLPELHRVLHQIPESNSKMHVTRGLKELFYELVHVKSVN